MSLTHDTGYQVCPCVPRMDGCKEKELVPRAPRTVSHAPQKEVAGAGWGEETATQPSRAVTPARPRQDHVGRGLGLGHLFIGS